MQRPALVGSLFLSAAAVACLFVCRPLSATAQTNKSIQQSNDGWLEGTILTADGHVVANPFNLGPGGASVHGIRQGGGEFNVASDKALGGLYMAKGIKPGVYEVFVTNGFLNSSIKLHPQRFHGVLVKPGVRTVLNVTMDPGETLEETGKPVVATEPAIVLSVELARLKSEVEQLKAH